MKLASLRFRKNLAHGIPSENCFEFVIWLEFIKVEKPEEQFPVIINYPVTQEQASADLKTTFILNSVYNNRFLSSPLKKTLILRHIMTKTQIHCIN